MKPVFRKRLLGRIDVQYYRCDSCGFLRTEDPHWLGDAYDSPLSALDTSLMARPIGLRETVCRLICRHCDPGGRFLDYGGGSGAFVRMMRDLGYRFYRYDRYAPNLFARCFDLEDLPEAERKFELLTAFEVMEHLTDPVSVVRSWSDSSDVVLFSTELQPGGTPADGLEKWPYLGEAHGQHVSFHTERSLAALAALAGFRYRRAGRYLHIFSRRPLNAWLDPAEWKSARIPRMIRGIWSRIEHGERYWLTRRTSLVELDQAEVERRLGSKQWT